MEVDAAPGDKPADHAQAKPPRGRYLLRFVLLALLGHTVASYAFSFALLFQAGARRVLLGQLGDMTPTDMAWEFLFLPVSCLPIAFAVSAMIAQYSALGAYVGFTLSWRLHAGLRVSMVMGVVLGALFGALSLYSSMRSDEVEGLMAAWETRLGVVVTVELSAAIAGATCAMVVWRGVVHPLRALRA